MNAIAADHMLSNSQNRSLNFVKGEERFIFNYVAGHEDRLLSVFAEFVLNPDIDFDETDAELLEYQLRRRLQTSD